MKPGDINTNTMKPGFMRGIVHQALVAKMNLLTDYLMLIYLIFETKILIGYLNRFGV